MDPIRPKHLDLGVRVDASPEELEKIRAALKEGPSTVLVSSPDASTGYRPLTLAERHEAGMSVSAERFSSAPVGRSLSELVAGHPGADVVLVPELHVAKLGRNVRFAVFVPGGHDPRAKRPIHTLLPGDGVTLARGLKGQLRDRVAQLRKEKKSREAVIVVPELTTFGKMSEKDLGQILADEITPWVAALFSDGATRDARPKDQFEVAAVAPVVAAAVPRVRGVPVMRFGHDWRSVPGELAWDRPLPPAPRGAATEVIPLDVQRQPAKTGTLFAPIIQSRAIDESVRFGLYLPPGYDPNDKARYPVLFLLPGRAADLAVWASVGGLAPKLDHMMSGDAQKMVVIVVPSTDSYWFDYDKNGHADFDKKTRDRRDFEGLIMDELLPYATQTVKGDRTRMAIAGISRGGFGAMHLSLRHPGVFSSVSAHAGILAFAHGDDWLSITARTAVTQGHFGPAKSGVWSRFNPADLIEAGAGRGQYPRMYLDAGREDRIAGRDTFYFSDLLDRHKIPHQLAIWGSHKTKLEHNWDTWGETNEHWIAFHQATFGRAGKPAAPDHIKDVSRAAEAAEGDRRRQVRGEMQRLAESIPGLLEHVKERIDHALDSVDKDGRRSERYGRWKSSLMETLEEAASLPGEARRMMQAGSIHDGEALFELLREHRQEVLDALERKHA